MKFMKINGEPTGKIENQFGSFTLYHVTLKGGPMDKMPSLAGNTRVVYAGGHRYELNPAGDFVYAPEGLN